MAIVVDPIRTISAGKVNLGAFRTYPKGYKPPDDTSSEYQTIPLNKIEDFGVHCKQYYRCLLKLQTFIKLLHFWFQHGRNLLQVCIGQVPVRLSLESLLGEYKILIECLTCKLFQTCLSQVNTLSSSSLLTNAEYTTGQVHVTIS